MIRRQRHDELENQLNKGAMWAVTYGDLMSYMMIFFLVLFSFSISKKNSAASSRYEESLSNIQRTFGGKTNVKMLEKAKAQQNEDALARQVRDDKRLAGMVQVESTETKVRLVLTEAVLFDSGRAELKSRARGILSNLSEKLKGLPNDIVVEGHTDNLRIRKGRFASNWELSMSRAYAVISYFEETGMAPARLAGIGYGENRPLEDNSTPEGRAKNRRIEIDLIKTR